MYILINAMMRTALMKNIFMSSQISKESVFIFNI